MNAFEVRDVTYQYGRVAALNGLSLSIAAGRRCALLGANGSGKSTLLRLLDGLYFPAAGSISFFDVPLSESLLSDDHFAMPFRRRIGFVFQNADVQLFNASVFDEVAFGPLQLRWPAPKIREEVERTLELLGIPHLRDRAPHRLSGGEKKRVALASVLVVDPDVLLLDEPTAALDPRSQSQIIDFLVGWGDGTRTIVTATHDLGAIEDIADHCFVLDQGRLAAEGTPSAILADTELLARSNLIHAHRHRHASGEMHWHPHLHRLRD